MSNDRHVLAEIPVKKRAAPSLDIDLDEPFECDGTLNLTHLDSK